MTSVLVGTKHLALNGGNCQDSSKSTLTAIASSVANITSTDHEDLMFDGLSARKQRDPWALALLCPTFFPLSCENKLLRDLLGLVNIFSVGLHVTII